MEKFTYENQGVNTYLVYAVDKDDVIDSMALGMITNNNISGLAQTTCVQINADKFIKYNISAKIAASQFFLGAVNKTRLLGVFSGIVDALISSEDYMLDPTMIMLDLEQIYVDVSNCETILICLPIQKTEFVPVDLLSFFKNIMFSSQFDQTENCDYVAVIMNHLNSTPSFSLVDFKNLLDKLKNDNSRTASTQTFQNKQNASLNVKENNAVQREQLIQPAVNTKTQPIVMDTQFVVEQPQLKSVNSVDSRAGNTEVMNFNETATVSEKQSDEVKQMSKMYLLQHYSKENKAIYDAQQEKKKKSQETAEKNIQNQETNEKPMTMMYLLQHYSKENKAIYDAQQAAKKSKGNTAKSATANKVQKSASSFAIPGQPAASVVSVAEDKNTKSDIISKPSLNVNMPSKVYSDSLSKDEPTKPEATVYNNKSFISQQIINIPKNDNDLGVALSSANFGETTVLGGGSIGETTVLSGDMNAVTAMPHLIRSKNHERININKPIFRIGKERSYVDYFVADNTAISRSHANIITREDRYFIVDTNSTNHTFVDGQMIPSNSEFEITHGAKIRLANEDFEFNVF